MRLRNPSRARRGSILIVVIGLLALFAVVGLSFVLYADAEATAARSARAARNDDALPDPAIPAQDFLRQLIFDTTDPTSTLRGHGLLTSRFESGMNVPFTGIGLPAGTTSINYTSAGTNAVPTGQAVPWTYPDLNNFYLAWLDPTTGKVTVPSFHRSGIFASLAPNSPDMTDPNGYLKTLRPHPSKHPNFPRVPANPDGTYTGDVANLKFMTGSQTNDSLWMYYGSPVQTWRGRQYVAMVAPLVLDLSGRVNESVAGNNRVNGTTHGSTHGFGPWEINPLAVMGAANQADLTALITARYNATTVPGDRYSGGTTGLINRGRNSSNVNESRPTPFYSRLDVDCVGSAPDGPPNPPIAMGTYPFLDYTSRFDNAGSTPAAHANHMSMFNPFQWPRGSASGMAHGFGMDDLVKLGSRYNDPKNRYTSSEIATKAPTSMANADVRHLTTAFNVSQRWGRLPVNGGAAYVGPVDLNRPLPDYRTNPANPLSSTNIVTGAQLTAADNAREQLAWDVFVRLLAVANLVDGANITYTANNGRVTFAGAPTPQMKQLAQFAVNIVDYIDGDDIMTRFQWHDATDVVFGTELPKLVVNEAYSAVFNADNDSAPMVKKTMGQPDTYPAKEAPNKRFWVELYNPLKTDSILPDGGAARLRDVDANGNPINVYELIIGEDAGANGTSFSSYLQQSPDYAAKDPALGGLNVKIRVNDFNSGTPNANFTGSERFLVRPADAAPPTVATAVPKGNVGYYVVGPKDRKPRDQQITTFPDMQDATGVTLSFEPQASGANAQNMMQYPIVTANGGPTVNEIGDATTKAKHTVVLRRLANPYAMLNINSNPYITVDLIEAVPSQDRVEYDKDDKRANFMKDNNASIGKRHPYASGVYTPAGAGQQALALQTGAATPPHTFFLQNSNLDNVNGLAWLAHMDRELVNATEILQTSIYSPALLTKQFFNGNAVAGTNYNQHYHSPTGTLGNLLDTTAQTGGYVLVPQGYKAFDVLTVASRLPGIPLGGREPGLVNVNTINDPRVWNAVIDPQAGNTFNAATVPWTLFSGATGKRTPDPLGVPKISDTPIQPYSATGAAQANTLLWIGANPTLPAMFNQAPTNASSHDYFKSEPMRKVMNNLTTVSDGFLVIWTVGFFELDTTVTPNPGANGPIIGKELYERVPGDLRSQFVAVVDRSMVTVDATIAVNPTPKLGNKPAETKTTDDAPSGTNQLTVQGTAAGIYLDGNLVPFTGQFRLGLGDAASGTGDGEWVTVAAAVPNGNPGQVTLTITPTAYYHGAGTRLSSGLLGAPNPTQVTTFNSTDPANRHIVPYYIRLQP